jgi:hypothetical protein
LRQNSAAARWRGNGRCPVPAFPPESSEAVRKSPAAEPFHRMDSSLSGEADARVFVAAFLWRYCSTTGFNCQPAVLKNTVCFFRVFPHLHNRFFFQKAEDLFSSGFLSFFVIFLCGRLSHSDAFPGNTVFKFT